MLVSFHFQLRQRGNQLADVMLWLDALIVFPHFRGVVMFGV
ncbi:hypothetical protein BN4901_0104 [Citrobacter europaeus]|uniref:Uncharacterized protein n=1 Tax=Citrobacter europaeus TaxID=1914243 RepID=A0ABY0JKG9_9ENTR|nr:hypothetical protein CIP106467_3034 [Citrobacter europaeus]SBW23316.1 hypothetical protein BN4901_0104 [Citrobacter europaeus]